MSVREIVLYRRKRIGRTNYKKRLVYLKSNQPRLVVRKTNKQMLLQIVKYEPDGDKVICGVSSAALKKLGWKYSCKNTPACYLTGVMLGKAAKSHKVTEAIADFGLQTNVPGSKIYAAIKGAIDAGLKVPVSEEVLPKKERISGAHITEYYSKAGDKQFSKYKKEKVDAKIDVDGFKKKILA